MIGRPTRRAEDNIRMDLREVGCDDVNWINVAQDREQWRAFVKVQLLVTICTDDCITGECGHVLH
jgi:hypothetical protein